MAYKTINASYSLGGSHKLVENLPTAKEGPNNKLQGLWPASKRVGAYSNQEWRLKEASNLAEDPEIMSALFHKSEGLIGKTVNLIKKAAVKAIKSKREYIIADDIEYLPKL